MTLPTSLVRRRDTHRLIPARFSEPEPNALSMLEGRAEDIEGSQQVERNTRGTVPNLPAGLDPAELVSGVPWAHVINGAFRFPHALGSRFNAPSRGAWYGAYERATSIAEVAWHLAVPLADMGWPDFTVVHDHYVADFSATFHDLRSAPDYADCLPPDDYRASQRLAARLLAEGSAGIVYPSVRRQGGTCLACFRPGLVQNLRRHARLRFTWAGSPKPKVSVEARS